MISLICRLAGWNFKLKNKNVKKMTYTFDKVMHWVVAIVFIVVAYFLLSRLGGVLLPFLVAWLIAYLFNPIVVLFKRWLRLKTRVIPVIIVLLLLVGFLIGLGFLLVPMIEKEIIHGRDLFLQFWEMHETQDIWQGFIGSVMEYFNGKDIMSIIDVQTIESVSEKLMPGILGILEGTWQFIAGIAIVGISILYLIFIMLDYDNVNMDFKKMIPEKYNDLVLGIIHDVEDGMNSYFRGQALVAFIVGILFAIGFVIVGLPLGITVGLFIGVLNLVPYLQTIGIVPVALLAMMKSFETNESFWIVAVECAAVFLVVQTIQDMFLVPKIMGKAMGLKPAIILLALSIWGSLLGFVGMIIALPLTTLMISYYKRYILKGNKLSK